MEVYSILMSVYCKVNPVFFEKAVQSMLDQSIRTDDFVIVCDGPLTGELEGVLERCTEQYPGIFNIVRLPQNVGIGAAANAGLRVCKNDLIAKMDSDDIAVQNRCELQLKRFAEKPELIVLGGYIEEFDEDPETPFSVRSVPESNEAIRKFARRRQPFNNQTVMYRKSAVSEVGGYSNLRRNEDYDLYVRLLAKGCYAENLPVTLVKVRVDGDAQNRRASKSTLIGCIQSRWRAYRIGYSSLLDFLYCTAGQLIVCICPGKLQKMIYTNFLRCSCNAGQEE